MHQSRCAILALGVCLPFLASAQHQARPVTVEQLEQELMAVHDTPDAKAAHQISDLELTQRMSDTRLAPWKTRLPGAKSWDALVALADLSAFLDPPAAEIPADAPPDLAAQQRMMLNIINYLKTTIPKLPNFIATQTTIRYEEYTQNDRLPAEDDHIDRPLQKTGSTDATVVYRNGIDVVEVPARHGSIENVDVGRLQTTGAFGTILSVMVPNVITSHSVLSWSRWGQGARGLRAIYRYTVPENKSLYEITFCCLPESNGTIAFKKKPGYHGEIVVDPVSGAILRMTVVAELTPTLPIIQSEIMVDYKPVEIGGKTYICPSRSIYFVRGRSLRPYNSYLFGSSSVYGPYISMLNDVSYEGYHIFRAESRVLATDEPVPEEQQGNPGATETPAPEPKPMP